MAPASPSARAMPRPAPRVAPATRATCPSSGFMDPPFGIFLTFPRRLGTTFATRLCMNRVMPTSLLVGGHPSSIDRRPHDYRHTRVLRWIFRRDGEDVVVCELGLTGEDREYELRAPAEWNPTGKSVERFDDALTAFQRHAMIERQLLDLGWVLDQFQSERVTVH